MLCFSQKTQFRHNFIVVFQPTFSDYISSFPISFCLCDFIVLLSHVHVSGCVSSIFFTAVIKTLKLLFKLFGTPSNMFFSMVFSFRHFHIVTAYNLVYLVNLFSVVICNGYLRLRHALRNIWFFMILANCHLPNWDFANFRILVFLNLPITTLANLFFHLKFLDSIFFTEFSNILIVSLSIYFPSFKAWILNNLLVIVLISVGIINSLFHQLWYKRFKNVLRTMVWLDELRIFLV